eukprot:PhM_4_TR11230/c0_g1_i1/m.74057
MYRPKHYEVNIELDFASHTVQGNVVCTLEADTPLQWRSISLLCPRHDVQDASLTNVIAVPKRAGDATCAEEATEPGTSGTDAPQPEKNEAPPTDGHKTFNAAPPWEVDITSDGVTHEAGECVLAFPGDRPATTQVVLRYSFVSSDSCPYYMTTHGSTYLSFFGETGTDVADLFPYVSCTTNAEFTFNVTIPSEMTATSNVCIMSETVSPTNPELKTVMFRSTPTLSVSQIALVAGKMQSMRPMPCKSGILLRVIVPEGCDLSHTRTALDVTLKAFDYFEDAFSHKLVASLKKVDIIAVNYDQVPGRGHWGIVPFPYDFLFVTESTSIAMRQELTLRAVREAIRHWFGALVKGRTDADDNAIDGIARYLEYMYVESQFPRWHIWIRFIWNVLEPYRRGNKRRDYWMACMLRMLSGFVGERPLVECLNTLLQRAGDGCIVVADLWTLLQDKLPKDINVDLQGLAAQLDADSGAHPYLFVRGTPGGRVEVLQFTTPNYRKGIIHKVKRVPGGSPSRMLAVGSGYTPPSITMASMTNSSPVDAVVTPRCAPEPVILDPAEEFNRGTLTLPVRVLEFRKNETVQSRTMVVAIESSASTPRPEAAQSTLVLNEGHSGLLRVDYSTWMWDRVIEVRPSLKAVEKVGIITDLAALRLFNVGQYVGDEWDRSTIFFRLVKEMHEDERHCAVWQAVSYELYTLLCLSQDHACGEPIRKFVRAVYRFILPSPTFVSSADVSVFDYNPTKVIPHSVLAGMLRNLALSGDRDVVAAAEEYVETVFSGFTSDTVVSVENVDYDVLAVALFVVLGNTESDADMIAQRWMDVFCVLTSVMQEPPSLRPNFGDDLPVLPTKLKKETVAALNSFRGNVRKACLAGLVSVSNSAILSNTVALVLDQRVNVKDLRRCADFAVYNVKFLDALLEAVPTNAPLSDHHKAVLLTFFGQDDKICSGHIQRQLRRRPEVLQVLGDLDETIGALHMWMDCAAEPITRYVSQCGLVPEPFEDRMAGASTLPDTSLMKDSV